MTAIKILHDFLEFHGKFVGANLRRVGKAIHHIGDAAVLQRFGNGFPAILEKLGCIRRFNAFRNHLVEAEKSAGLQHSTKNRLLAHQVGLDFGDKGAFENSRPIRMKACGISLGIIPALSFRIVIRLDGNQTGHTETADIFCTDFGTRPLRRAHDNRDVVANLLAFFDDIETVAVRKDGTLFHERHDLRNHIMVLLVRCEVQNEVGTRNQFLISSHLETVFRRILERSALFLNRRFTKSERNIKTAVAKIKSLMKPLCTTADNDNLFSLKRFGSAREFRCFHKTAMTQFLDLGTERKCIEVVHFITSKVFATERKCSNSG